MSEKTIFQSALAIDDDAERAAFLDEACTGNPQLRFEVEQLLKSLDAAGSFLETPAVAPVVQPTVIAGQADDLGFLEPSATADSLGKLGHYDVQAVLGRGAFGIVLKAFDERLHRVVAIKVMNAELAATSPPRKRFLREARSSASVRHENIVAIHAVEEQPIPYLVMEYVPGETLQQRLDGHGPLDVAEVLKIGQQIALGLAAAHAQGLIHRDIKPANILIETGLEERVKITDFGLARAVDDASLTQSGLIAGTPMFMAPEQARGEALDHRTDLFSLGSVLYTMVSGRPPFRAPHTLAVLKRVCEDTPRPIDEVMPGTPAWLCDIIAQLQAKEPDDRFASAKEVADLLGRCADDLRHGRTVAAKVARPATPGIAAVANVATHAGGKARSVLWVLLIAALSGAIALPFSLGLIGAPEAVILLLVFCAIAILTGQKSPTALARSQTVAAPRSPVIATPFMGGDRSTQGALKSLRGLGIGLVITAGLNIIDMIGLLLASYIVADRPGESFLSVGPRELLMLLPIVAAGSGVILLGGLNMLRGERYGLCLLGCIAALFVGPMYAIGWPVAIWALIVLNRTEVREAFARQAAARAVAAQTRRSPTANPLAILVGLLAIPIIGGVVLFVGWAVPAYRAVYAPIPTLPVQSVAGGLQFDGKDDYVQIKNVNWNYPQFTLEAFVTSAPDGDNGVIALLHSQGDHPESMFLFDGPAHEEERNSGAGILGRNAYNNAIAPLSTGVRQHRALVYDGKLLHYFVNGVWQGKRYNAAHVGMAWDIDELLIGCKPSQTEFFRGRIYQLRVSRVARYTANFSAVTSVAADDVTLALYNFDDGAGDVLRDASGNGHDGQIFGATWVTPIASRASTVDGTRAAPPHGPWQSLFNGRDLSGWKTLPQQPSGWKVERGVLVGTGPVSHLFTERSDYRDFEFRCEVRLGERGNSGVFLRTPFAFAQPDQQVTSPAGYEVQLAEGKHLDSTQQYLSGGLLPLANPGGPNLIRAGQWHKLRVKAVGDQFDVWIDDVQTVSVIDPVPRRHQGGHLALQVWTPETRAEFRSLEIRNLSPTASPSATGQFSSGEWIDVMPLIDPNLDKWDLPKATGQNAWRVMNGELAVAPDRMASKLILPLDVNGPALECDVEFTRRTGNTGLNINLPSTAADLPLVIDATRNGGVWLGSRDRGVLLADGARIQTGTLATVHVEIRRRDNADHVAVSFNGASVGTWTGNRDGIANRIQENYPHDRRLSLWIHPGGNEFVFHRIRVRMLDGGTAMALRPIPSGEPAQDRAAAVAPIDSSGVTYDRADLPVSALAPANAP